MNSHEKGVVGLTNSEGKVVDRYIPRKCSATSRLIGPKDHASVQFSIAHVDSDGHACKSVNDCVTFAFCGDIRSRGGVDEALMLLAQKHNLMQPI
ncbi:Ribosomal protein S21 [Giardia muris]|uniref:40S ribosomal protein S21 n=1 Tax=Giardia muris TaxID=5742 RepID=A0A4Z1SWL0_GIAMU|nr:Ribosomal protein S21 [Giardia muris]|eukprot:TNJ30202.1 Ribosomal protein S21 [Giardia muris]